GACACNAQTAATASTAARTGTLLNLLFHFLPLLYFSTSPTALPRSSRRHLHDAMIRGCFARQVGQSAALHLAAHRVKLVSDDGDRVAVHRSWKGRQDLPAIGNRIVRLERAVGGVVPFVLILAARDVDLSVVRRPAAAAARSDHARLCHAPRVANGVVLLDNV